MRVLSGIQPSGRLHLGNYFGMMKPAIELQYKAETFIFIANYHALTTVSDAQTLREDTWRVAVDFLACGLDPERTVFFLQSDVPQVTELAWLLSIVTPVGLLERCHSYKDKIAKGIAPSHGLFAYPVLMAADILAYQSNVVPVGRDQKQHVEVTRDIALKFNARYGQVFTVPEADIREEVAVVPGIDGQKMSKSYNNHIEIFGDETETRERIMRIVTDSKTLREPKDPEKCNVFALYRLFATEEQREEMARRYREGGYGYSEAKKALFELMWKTFEPFRRKRDDLLRNMDYVREVLRKGGERARAEAEKTLRTARYAVGIDG
ncbi:MAG: tryptophan--tRNA ligase [Kiritimatiellae bacterium]|nr:tryptophan--tRNA ligase [Kiritimatiellia bacterium]